jgi:hypothetical protein
VEKELDRAAQKVDHEVFRQLVELTLYHSWLEEESFALTELWNLCGKKSEQNLLYDLIYLYYEFGYITTEQLTRYLDSQK